MGLVEHVALLLAAHTRLQELGVGLVEHVALLLAAHTRSRS